MVECVTDCNSPWDIWVFCCLWSRHLKVLNSLSKTCSKYFVFHHFGALESCEYNANVTFSIGMQTREQAFVYLHNQQLWSSIIIDLELWFCPPGDWTFVQTLNRFCREIFKGFSWKTAAKKKKKCCRKLCSLTKSLSKAKAHFKFEW